MPEFTCAFSSPLISGQFGCAKGIPVVRRGGAEVACQNENAHRRCRHVMVQFKTTALPAFGVEDDLLSMPHSVLVKIQYGGLLGLQRLMKKAASLEAQVADIDELLQAAQARYGAVEDFPCDQLTPDITAFKLSRRKPGK